MIPLGKALKNGEEGQVGRREVPGSFWGSQWEKTAEEPTFWKILQKRPS